LNANIIACDFNFRKINYLILKTTIMAIKYYLQPNAVTPDPDDHFARVLPTGILDADDIIKKMLERGSTITESDSRAVLTMFFKVVIAELADGKFINLPIANLRCGITGVFSNAADTFDRSRHGVKATISAGSELWDAMQAVTVEKQSQPVISPYILQYEDVNSATFNTVLTKGGIGIITGEELKFDPTNTDEGIFFVNAAGAATKVAVIANRTASKLTFSVPTTLAAGAYTLEVRKAYTAAKTIRTGALSEKLTVA